MPEAGKGAGGRESLPPPGRVLPERLRFLSRLVTAPRWPVAGWRSAVLGAACLGVVLLPLLVFEPGSSGYASAAEAAHAVLLVLLALAGLRLPLPAGLGLAVVSEGVLAGARLAASDDPRALVLVWALLGPGLVAGVWLLSEHHRAERRLRRELEALTGSLEDKVAARTSALQAANAELEAYSYTVSHDLRAPLRAIRTAAGILDETGAGRGSAEAERFITLIGTSAERMGLLIDDLLRLARVGREPMRSAPVDLTGLARDVADELSAATADRDLRMVIEPMPEAAGDPGLLRQVLANLIGNAVAFTSGHDPSTIRVGARPGERGTVYFVEDDGIGIDPDDAARIFAPFTRLQPDPGRPGSGIGLSIVERIVRRHGGRVWAEGARGRGATLCFTIGTEPVPG